MTIFLPKINKVFLRPILQFNWTVGLFWTTFLLKSILSTSQKRCHQAKSLKGDHGEKRKMVVKIEFIHLPHCKIVSFKKILNNSAIMGRVFLSVENF